MDVDYGYWRVSQTSDNVLLCPTKAACRGGSNVSTQCRNGHRGMYCSVCVGEVGMCCTDMSCIVYT